MTQVIDNTGIKEIERNGARTQALLLKIDNELYKISINCESYSRQSYARLMVMTPDKKWTNIKTIEPQRDYSIDISYSSRYSTTVFNPIIYDFLKLIAKLHNTDEKGLLTLI